MMSTDEHALDIESQLSADMRKTLRSYGVGSRLIGHDMFGLLLDELVLDAMHQVEKLLIHAEWDEPHV
jgi:hypothetical protein